jgi:hypothetical protein
VTRSKELRRIEEAIADHLDGNIALARLTGETEAESLHREYIRRLHNYLASAKTLVDHTRAFRLRHVSDEAFNRDHESHLQELLGHAVVHFYRVSGTLFVTPSSRGS